MNSVTSEILEQLKKIESGLAKTRLELLLRRNDLNKKTRKLIEKYLEILIETEKFFTIKLKSHYEI